MPYELSFTKQVSCMPREEYINECCVGGDSVVNHLLPLVRAHYTDIQTNQEDWGWFIWFRKGSVKLAIDVFTEDPEQGSFKVHLTSRIKRLLRASVQDAPELEELRVLVADALSEWGADVTAVHLDRNYM